MDEEADLLAIRELARTIVGRCNVALTQRSGTVVPLPESQMRAATVASECRSFLADHGSMTLDDARTIIRDHYPHGTGRLFGDRFSAPGRCRVLYRENTPRGTRPEGGQKVSLTEEGIRLADLYDKMIAESLREVLV
jgi:hypothetical protein